MATDYVVEHLDRVASTQDEARDRFGGVPLAVSATAQDAGRGRSGAGWLNADRALAVSVAFTLPWPASSAPLLTLVAGLAARQALGPSGVLLKWPNDLVTEEGAKLGGILSELNGSVVVIGCGANLYWSNPPAGMAARFRDDPGRGRTRQLAESFVASMLARIAAGPDDWGRAEYQAACSTVGTTIEWDGGLGVARDVDERGGLVVVGEDGSELTLRSGEVRHVRAATLSPHEEGFPSE